MTTTKADDSIPGGSTGVLEEAAVLPHAEDRDARSIDRRDAARNLEEMHLPGSVMIPLNRAFKASKAVCKVGQDASGFLAKVTLGSLADGISIYGLMTNNHVVDTKRIASNKIIKLTFELFDDKDYDGAQNVEFLLQVSESSFFFTCPLLDVTFVEMNVDVIESLQDKTNNMITKQHFLYITKVIPDIKQRTGLCLYVIHYPGGGPKYASAGNMDSKHGFNLHYTASTEGGSSGSPLIALTTQVFGVHKASGERFKDNFNVACSADEIIKAIERCYAEKYNNLVTVARLSDLDTIVSTLGVTLCEPEKDEEERITFHKVVVNTGQYWFTLTGHGWYWTFEQPHKKVAKQHWISIHDNYKFVEGRDDILIQIIDHLKNPDA